MERSGHRIRRSGFLQSEIEAAFTELIHTRWSVVEPSWNPAIDIYDIGEAFVVVADLPGISRAHVQMDIHENSVTFCGTRQTMFSVNKGQSLVTERAKGRFCRTVKLPGPVDPDRAVVSFEDGVYRIELPKKRLLKSGGKR
jgi:HSP20 family protein